MATLLRVLGLNGGHNASLVGPSKHLQHKRQGVRGMPTMPRLNVQRYTSGVQRVVSRKSSQGDNGLIEADVAEVAPKPATKKRAPRTRKAKLEEPQVNPKILYSSETATIRHTSYKGRSENEQVVTIERPGEVDYRRSELLVMKPLPRVLIIHTGGTLGMDPTASYIVEHGDLNTVQLREGTGGSYAAALKPSQVLANLLNFVPELQNFANLDVQVPFNRDSCRVGPNEWIKLAKILHEKRRDYDAFLVVHGTDTMAYTASALSLMLSGFEKPIVMTGSQLPLLLPRSDARQNLIDSITVATAYSSAPYVQLHELALCFGGKLLRGNRSQKTNSVVYGAFSSPSYPELATLGVEVNWNELQLLPKPRSYQPRFNLDPRVLRIPIVPGCDPRTSYGDLYGRGVRGIVLEAFGTGNMPDTPAHGWLPWLRQQRKKGLLVYLASQCLTGELQPELYRSGALALEMGVESGPQMTPECAVAKMMLCLSYRDLALTAPLAGEL
uniref:asparaginase n=1 Tax=Pyramimonas obovata TaxID=1411642 RepID=A0A7S0RJ05_9CHLO|mmetsp:Transcript_35270/g.77081  ORF Transcript_35270/g.77081 Transcript_35270/m.77081 type:complete len:498 (+) Transcript_35270:361-1854(+)|eukprot:CAMPEP_0118934884 /NCGR_PEP_ID=MMETSP1169-20130426/14416_1 /TAXON_ID=36882 /ORGANISM="Pyramimonas obovata, Strain CCMP722" /LENGTH=497 /DNA_ID=CAMNT_0006877839 /DNA_START=361 /DNA_END=1854 /DNA_ORIENTATION=+